MRQEPTNDTPERNRLYHNLRRWRYEDEDSRIIEPEPDEPVTVGELREALDAAALERLKADGFEPYRGKLWEASAAVGALMERRRASRPDVEDLPLPNATLYVTMTPNGNEQAWHPQVIADSADRDDTWVLFGCKLHDKDRAVAVTQAWWACIFEDFEPADWNLPPE